jgi:hypothetical protein
MADEGYLEVGCNLQGEVVVNLPKNMTGHIVFSPAQAQAFALSLMKQARLVISGVGDWADTIEVKA